MKAFGLEDMTFAKAFMRKVLTEGVATATFANRLSDKRYADFAGFNFAALGRRHRTNAATTTRRQICAQNRRG